MTRPSGLSHVSVSDVSDNTMFWCWLYMFGWAEDRKVALSMTGGSLGDSRVIVLSIGCIWFPVWSWYNVSEWASHVSVQVCACMM